MTNIDGHLPGASTGALAGDLPLEDKEQVFSDLSWWLHLSPFQRFYFGMKARYYIIVNASFILWLLLFVSAGLLLLSVLVPALNLPVGILLLTTGFLLGVIFVFEVERRRK